MKQNLLISKGFYKVHNLNNSNNQANRVAKVAAHIAGK